MTQIGHEINGFPLDTVACPSADVLAKHPDLAFRYADPYNIAALL